MSLSNGRSIDKAKASVFRLLKIRLRSEKEIRDKLAVKAFDNDVIEDVVQYFKDIELIDDSVFTEQWISSRLKKPFGARRIRSELLAKGIDRELLQEGLDRATEDYEEFSVVNELAQRRAAKYAHLPEEKIKQRTYAYLVRRGFSAAVIQKAIKAL